MESIIFKTFQTVFNLVGVLMLTGTLVSALADIQKFAFNSKRVGLASMLRVNEQLVGKTK